MEKVYRVTSKSASFMELVLDDPRQDDNPRIVSRLEIENFDDIQIGRCYRIISQHSTTVMIKVKD